LHTGGTFQAQVGSNSTARSMLGLRGTAYVQRGSPKGKKKKSARPESTSSMNGSTLSSR